MDGAFLIDKPAGWTSHDVVAVIRRAIHLRRVGHAGTLDPFATGLLVVCFGRATRLIQFLAGSDKEYQARVRLGFATDTQDLTGSALGPPHATDMITPEVITAALAGMLGPQLQMPPMYSAKKVLGERLYLAARRGKEVGRDACEVFIHRLEMGNESLLSRQSDGTLEFPLRVVCSTGTYVRTIAHDLGLALGVGGHLTALRRTRIGHLSLSAAIDTSEIARPSPDELLSRAISPVEIVAHLPRLTLDVDQARLFLNGREVPVVRLDEPCGFVAVLESGGSLLGVARTEPGSAAIRPVVVVGSDRAAFSTGRAVQADATS